MFAELPELEIRWRSLSTTERPKATQLLGDASRMVVRFYPAVPARVTTDPDLASDVAMVVCNMVRRAMDSDGTPANVGEETDRRGPFAITRKFSTPAGELNFTAREEAILAGTVQRPPGALPVWTGEST